MFTSKLTSDLSKKLLVGLVWTFPYQQKLFLFSQRFEFGAVGSRFSNCVRYFTTRNISGRLFYKRRPRQIPKHKFKNWRSKWLEGCPHKKGICVRVFVQTPRKPNSALRKVARVRLSTGKTVLCYIPGKGHNLTTHSVVLVRGGRTQDVPGCNYKIVRGKNDLLPVKNRWTRRSLYGVKLSDMERQVRLRKQDHKAPLFIKQDLDNFNKYQWMTSTDSSGKPLLEPLKEPTELPIHPLWNIRYKRLLEKLEKKRAST